jgi:hypothetical protein
MYIYVYVYIYPSQLRNRLSVLIYSVLCGTHPPQQLNPKPLPQLHDFDLDEMQALCPKTMQILRDVPRIYRHSMFSAITPGTHIIPHNGPTNKKLRVHLGAFPRNLSRAISRLETHSASLASLLTF